MATAGTFTLVFDKSNNILQGITKIEIIDGRAVATYTDGLVLDLGPAEDFDATKVTNQAHTVGNVLVIEDNSRLTNYETLWAQMPQVVTSQTDDGDTETICGRAVHIDGNESITGSKTFNNYETVSAGNTSLIGQVLIQAGTDISGKGVNENDQCITLSHLTNGVDDTTTSITYDKIYHTYTLSNGSKNTISASIKDIILLVNNFDN